MEAFDGHDDFGEIYADVEAPPLTDATPDDDDLYTHHQPLDTNGDGDGDGDEKNDDVSVGSDSDDDDLNIVLNDDGGCNGPPPPLPVRALDCDGVDNDVDVGGGDRLADCSELVSRNGVKVGYGSRFFHRKYTRSGGSMSMGMALSFDKSRWNGEVVCTQSLVSSSSHVNWMRPAGVQWGYGSILPWHWRILDLNIETFPEKPWRVPGVDITDYFNFGLNENSWKLYCASLEQLRQKPAETGMPVGESLKLNQEGTREQIDQVVSVNELSPSSEFEWPKGRAIQVEDSTIERQPSMNVRRPPRSRDSDVIIQIKVHESSDDCSGSGNSTVMDASLEGEPILDNNRKIVNSSSDPDDVLSEDHLEVVKKSVDSSVPERTWLVPGVDEHEHQDKMDQHSGDAAEVPGGEIKAEEGIAIDTCSADPCWIESELSLGDQELSLTSYTDSDSEATENSEHADNEKSHSPLRRKTVHSVTSLKESLPLYSKNSKSNSFDRKPVDVAYYSRNRGPFRKEWRHQSGRHERGSNLNKRIESDNDNDASSISMSAARNLSLLGHKCSDYGVYKQRQQGFAHHKRRDIIYSRQTKQSCYYGGEKFNHGLFQTLHTKYSYREDREIFQENTNRHDWKHGNERDYKEGREIDGYHADWGYYDDDPSVHSCRESMQFLPEHSSFPEEERGTHRRRINHKYHGRDRYCNNDLDEFEFEFLNESYRMSTSAEREMEFLNDKHEEQFPYIDRDWKRSAQKDRNSDRPPLVLDNLWSGKSRNKCQKYTHHRTSYFRHCGQSYTNSVENYANDTSIHEKLGVRGRPKHARDNRGHDWSLDYTDAAEDEDFMIDSAEECQFYGFPSEVLNWTEDEIVHRHHEIHATSLLDKGQIDDIKLQRHQLNMPRRSGENCLKGSSKIMGMGKHWPAVLRGRKSVDFVNGKGKYTRNSRVLCNGNLEHVDQGMAKRQRALVSFGESHEKAIKSGTSKCGSSHGNKKVLQNLPDEEHKESLDIEEGQIVTEEPYTEASASKRDVSDGATPALNSSVKKRLSENEDNSDQLIGGYDSQRILDSLAKMEKRRERFKQPIATKKEAEECLKLDNDTVVDTGDMKQHRPARKRRWVA